MTGFISRSIALTFALAGAITNCLVSCNAADEKPAAGAAGTSSEAGGHSVAGASGDNGSTNGRDQKRIVSVAAGSSDICVVLASGRVACFGLGESLTDLPSPVAPHEAVLVNGIADAIDIGLGIDHACVLTRSGGVTCWGEGRSGQLGNGPTLSVSPAPVKTSSAPLSNVTLLRTGILSSCAGTPSGIYCWGANDSGWANGDSHVLRFNSATLVNPEPAQQLAVGHDFAVSITENGDLCAWGLNSDQQLGDGARNSLIWQPACATPPAPIAQLAAGYNFICARLNDASVRCWGRNAEGQLGIGASTPTTAPPFGTPIPNLVAVDLAAGYDHVCAIAEGRHEVDCWGRNQFGQLGSSAGYQSDTGSSTPHPAALVLTDNVTVDSIWAGPEASDTCVVLSDGTLTCWGNVTTLVNGRVGSDWTPHVVRATW